MLNAAMCILRCYLITWLLRTANHCHVHFSCLPNDPMKNSTMYVFLQYLKHPFTWLIKTITKFSNVIVYHQFSTNRRVYTSCLWLDSIIGQLKGQLTRHTCVSGQNKSCTRAFFSHFAELTAVVDFFFMKTYNRCLVSFYNFVIGLINW